VTDLAPILDTIDRANSADPNDFEGDPLALVQGRLAHGWVSQLKPDASAALQIAARAHHLRRWALPRAEFPEGRDGYLRWRREQKQAQADALTALLADAALDPATVERSCVILQKRGLGSDPEVQTYEDAVCLTFIETQFLSTADKLGDDNKMVEVVAKTLRKMTPAGHAAAETIALDERSADIIRRASEIV
jgi:hypothetical protein